MSGAGEPKRLFKCKLADHGTFYVVAPDETAARKAVEAQWASWDYTRSKGRVVSIETLAEEGQYPEVPKHNSIGSDTWLLVK